MRAPRLSRRPHRASGLTLIELIVAIGIVAVLVALAAPSFSEMISRQRVKGTTDEFVTAIQYARSEAVQRRSLVTVSLMSNNAMTCYSISTYSSIIGCDCRRSTNQCTSPDGLFVGGSLLKTVQLPRNNGVTIRAPNMGSNATFNIDPERGLVQYNTVIQVLVQGQASGQLLANIDKATVSVCSPDGSMSGVDPC